MRILFLVENYYNFYNDYLTENPEIQSKSYQEQYTRLFQQGFYQADSYAEAAKQLGHQATQIIMDCDILQRTWAQENHLFVPPTWLITRRPWRWWWTKMLKTIPKDKVRSRILLAQIKQEKPDILYVFSGVPVTSELLFQARKFVKYLVCQWSCPLPSGYPFHAYDLIVSSGKNIIQMFHEQGLQSEHLQHAFDGRILQKIGTSEMCNGVVFIGSVSKYHVYRLKVLDYLARHVDIDFYGVGFDELPIDSPIRQKYCGRAFGLDAYQIYSRYKIAIHVPIDIGLGFAGAKRLFEVTGVGTLLLTFAQPGLNELFEEGQEIVTYTDAADCVSKIQYYLANETERSTIAYKGQQRTLRDHNFKSRVKEFLAMLEK